MRMGERTNFLMHEGFLFKGNQLCIPYCSLRLRIIQELHGEGHVGRDCTFELIHDSYFWSSIRKRWSVLWKGVGFAKCLRGKLLTQGYTCLYLYRPSLGLISAWTLFWVTTDTTREWFHLCDSWSIFEDSALYPFQEDYWYYPCCSIVLPLDQPSTCFAIVYSFWQRYEILKSLLA